MKKVFAIKNQALGEFNDPFICSTVDHAIYLIRRMLLESKERGNLLSMDIENLSLFELGEYDSSMGIISAHSEPVLLLLEFKGLIEEVNKCAKI